MRRLVVVLAALAALPAAASHTTTEVKALLEAPTSKLKVTADPVAYFGQTPTSSECSHFKAAVLDALANSAASSDLLYGFLEAVSKNGTHTVTIKCAKFTGGNTGHTWAVVHGATINHKDGSKATHCENVATYEDASACTEELMAVRGGQQDDLMHAWNKLTGAGSGGHDAVIALDRTAGPTGYLVATLTNDKVPALNVAGSGRLSGGTSKMETPGAPLAVTVYHELIHGAKIAAGTYAAPAAPTGSVTDADLAAFKANMALNPTAIVVKGKKGAEAITALNTAVTREVLQEYAINAFGGTEYEEFQNLLTVGYTWGAHRLTENLVRKELKLSSFRNSYK